MAPMSPVPAARSVSSRMRSFSPAVNVRRLGRSDNSGLAAGGAGTTARLRPSSVPAPTAARASTTLLGMTTRQFSYALKSKLPGSLCLITIGTEGLAHLIRKGLALAGGLNPDGVRFGEWLVRELRNLIRAVADDKDHTILNPIQARLKRACKLHRDHDTEKIRQLAREILNDWAAIVAFVGNPLLPPTNNEAERALRHAVIARRLSFGTRTEEGSAAYAAKLSVVETCRRRGIDPWAYIADTLARARHGVPTRSPAPATVSPISPFLLPPDSE